MYDRTSRISFAALKDVRSPFDRAELESILEHGVRKSRAIIGYCALGCGVVIALFAIYQLRQSASHSAGVVRVQSSNRIPKSAPGNGASTTQFSTPENFLRNSTAQVHERTSRVHDVSSRHTGVRSQFLSSDIKDASASVGLDRLTTSHANAANHALQDNAVEVRADVMLTDPLMPVSPRERMSIAPAIGAAPIPMVLNLDQARPHEFVLAMNSSVTRPDLRFDAMYQLDEHWMVRGSVGYVARSVMSSVAGVQFRDTTVQVNGVDYTSKIGELVPQAQTRRDLLIALGPRFLLRPVGETWNLSADVSAGYVASAFTSFGAAGAQYALVDDVWIDAQLEATMLGPGSGSLNVRAGIEWEW